MIRSIRFAACAALMALAPFSQVQAQTVHKCTINGASVYQAAACPATNDSKSLVIPAAPSQQELLDATANGRLQNFQPGAGVAPQSTPRRYDRHAKSTEPQLQPSEQDDEIVPEDNCEQLNKAYHDAQYRREELSAPGTGATRAAGLQRAWDDLQRAQQQAVLTHCKLR
jgi:hypothetical protein